MSNDWQNKLRSEFEHYGEEAPEGLWASVRDSVAYPSAVSPALDPLRRRRRRNAWLAASGAFAVAAAVIAAVVVRPVAGPVQAAIRPGSVLASADDMPRVYHEAMGRPQKLYDSRTAVAVPVRSAVPEEMESEVPELRQKPLPGQSSREEQQSSAVSGGNAGSGEERLEFYDAPEFFGAAQAISGKRPGRTLSMRLAMSGSAFSRASSAGYGAMYGSSVAAMRFAARPLADDGYSAVLISNNHQDVSTSRRHYQPVGVGIRLGWEFAPSLSVVGGLEYSCLVSDLSSGTHDSRYETRQTLHYVGLPVSFEWSFVERPRFRAYVSAGGQVRKAVYGVTSTRYVIDNTVIGAAQTGRIREDRFQWSAGAGAGVEYLPGSGFGIFFEPGVNYYFDNGSCVENMFKSRPLNFSLSVGVRLWL